MNQLQAFGVTEKKGTPVVSSRNIAEMFKRQHSHILRTIDSLTQSTSGLSEKFIQTNFFKSFYKDSTGRKLLEYQTTRDGFMMTVMDFRTAKARALKEAYMERFNDMERFIQSLTAAKLDHPEFTKAIMSAHEEPKHYHFSNESDMINRIVLGMSAKKFKEANSLGNVPSIRPHLTPEQIEAIEKMQRFDIGLILVEPEFDKRKQVLTEYYSKLTAPKLRGISA